MKTILKTACAAAVAISALLTLTGSAAPAHSHIFAPQWMADGRYHWHKCIVAGCQAASDARTHQLHWESVASGHWQRCSVCGVRLSQGEHSFVRKGDITQCSECNYPLLWGAS